MDELNDDHKGVAAIKDSRLIPLTPVDWGNGDVRDVTLLELTTPDGITGLGSAYTGATPVRDALAMYQQDPAALHNADASTTIAMSAIDIALWDITGKEQDLPISELLGGRKHDRVLAYATVDLPMTSAKPGDAFDKTLRAALNQGFKAIKLSIENFGHHDDSKSEEEWTAHEARLLRFARKITGNNVRLMLDVYASDPNWKRDFDWALRTTRVLEELDFLWFEEPLPPRSYDDFVRLTQDTSMAISGAEDFILVKDFENLSNLKALNILQPDCTRVGGLTSMQSIRNAASQNGMEVIPHGWNTAVGLAADLQFQATAPNEKYCMVEVWRDRSITDLLKHSPFSLDSEGKITVPTGAGLGVELKDDFKI